MAMTAAMVVTAAAPAHAEGDWIQLGEALRLDHAIPITEIAADPAAFHDRVVRIEGRIASVCTQEGCFIEVVPPGGSEGIVVNFPGLAATFPTDCAGLEAVVEGRFYQKIYPHARVEHWQHHSFRPGVEIPEFSLALRMDARGARIGGERGARVAPSPIPSIQPDVVDLDRFGFEAEAFGIDRRRIAPGGSVPRPSTGGNRWLVLCREGKVVVARAYGRDLALTPGEMSFVQAGIDFNVRNTSNAGAVVELVYSRAVQPAHEH
jgi:hypothetical protein